MLTPWSSCPCVPTRYFVNALELPAKAVKHMGHALNFFHKCLKKTPDNVFAAHGLALVFAEVRQPSPTHLPLSTHLPPAGPALMERWNACSSALAQPSAHRR
jgi:hypothetical protein